MESVWLRAWHPATRSAHRHAVIRPPVALGSCDDLATMKTAAPDPGLREPGRFSARRPWKSSGRLPAWIGRVDDRRRATAVRVSAAALAVRADDVGPPSPNRGGTRHHRGLGVAVLPGIAARCARRTGAASGHRAGAGGQGDGHRGAGRQLISRRRSSTICSTSRQARWRVPRRSTRCSAGRPARVP